MNKNIIIERIKSLEKKALAVLEVNRSDYFQNNKKTIDDNLSRVAKAFCGSWIGYHSRIYYLGFKTPPPGDHFGPEWGFFMYYDPKLSGWREMTDEQVKNVIFSGIDKDYENRLDEICIEAKNALDEIESGIKIILRGLVGIINSNSLEEFKGDLLKIGGRFSAQDYIILPPSGTLS